LINKKPKGKQMNDSKYDIGMIGLGVMGRNLVLNMADHNFSVVGFDKDMTKVDALEKESGDKKVKGVRSLPEFINLLKKPRAVMMLVPAGAAVDSVIKDVLPHLEKGDLIIDGGNSHFIDTNRHEKELSPKGIHFMGVGISGGEKGARFGPSMMPGGPKDAYERIRPIFEAVAAHVDGEPCVTYLGPGSAGHYVKAVHNGIEYALIELISETYNVFKKGLNLSNDDLHDIYKKWNEGLLQSYLMEISYKIFLQPADGNDGRLIDLIKDQAKQKGTGKWTSQDAMELQDPLPVVDMAVDMRDMSGYKEEREEAAKILHGPEARLTEDKQELITRMESALYFAMITSYAQGMALLHRASSEYKYNLDLEAIARIWRGGCIIRAALLEDIRQAFDKNPELSNLMMDQNFARELNQRQTEVRHVINLAVKAGIPVPGFMAALSYFDSYRSAWLPANLIQAQRDFFGSHTYERIDKKGVFHTEWEK
jgi:6-phosphogluconate dehydrogenase